MPSPSASSKFVLSVLKFLGILKFLRCTQNNLGTLTCQIIMQQVLLFLGEKNTYTTLLGPTRLLIFEIFPSKPDFHLYK